jgi:hypothetical protein
VGRAEGGGPSLHLAHCVLLLQTYPVPFVVRIIPLCVDEVAQKITPKKAKRERKKQKKNHPPVPPAPQCVEVVSDDGCVVGVGR